MKINLLADNRRQVIQVAGMLDEVGQDVRQFPTVSEVQSQAAALVNFGGPFVFDKTICP